MVTLGGVMGDISLPAVIARPAGAKGTLICWVVGAKLTVWNGAVGKTVILEVAGIRTVVAEGVIAFAG